MGRTVDIHSGLAGRQLAERLGGIRAGLANGTMVHGETEREARGHGKEPTWGAILSPSQVDTVTRRWDVVRLRWLGRSSGR